MGKHEIKKILYLIPDNIDNDDILRKVFNFAGKKEASITFLLVLKDIHHEIKKMLKHHHNIELAEAYKNQQQKTITEKLEKYKKYNIEYNVKVLAGDRYELTLEELKNVDYDLMITTHFTGQLSLSEKIFGSKNMYLLRRAPCPVLIFLPKRKKETYKLLVAVDTEDQSDEIKAFNQKIIDYAFSASIHDNVEIHIVQCWHLYGESALASGFIKVDKETLKAMQADCENHYRQNFEALLKYLPKSEHMVKSHLINGEPTTAIPEFIEKNHIDMIVMGTTSRTNIRAVTIGNTAEDILQSTDCSVLAVKPDGFEPS